MTNITKAKTLYEWRLIHIRLARRPKTRCENDINEDLGIMKMNNWTKCIQDRLKWKKVTQKAKTFKQ
jgi:hypothetical protein